jgi:hypothetical protein
MHAGENLKLSQFPIKTLPLWLDTSIQTRAATEKKKAHQEVYERSQIHFRLQRERERDERDNAICINEELFLLSVQNRRRVPIAECSKTRRSGPRRWFGEACGPMFNQYATECSCAVAPTWMERNQSNPTI